MKIQELKKQLEQGAYERVFQWLYSEKAAEQPQRYAQALDDFGELFGKERDVQLFSAPGRTEVGGNHTDHQRGRVLAAGVNLDVIAVASPNQEGIIRIQSAGYPMDEVRLSDLSVHEEEKNKAISLIRGVAARFQQLGMEIGGFDAYTTSNVLKGSGLSSSAAFETVVGQMLNHLYSGEKATPVQIAQIGQYAENVYFGKPCGLMDQTACSVGGFVTIDFENPEHPKVEQVPVDFATAGYKLCIVDTGGNHSDLTGDYASIPVEMKSVAGFFGKEVLRQVPQEDFLSKVAQLREQCGDRAVLRAFHFYADNDRVPKQVAALGDRDFQRFKELVIESGNSSFEYLQNVYTCQNPQEQGLSLGLAISERILKGKGAWRVHGGGFAGTIQAFVPEDLLEEYRRSVEAVFGQGKCHVLSIRPIGGVCVTPELHQ